MARAPAHESKFYRIIGLDGFSSYLLIPSSALLSMVANLHDTDIEVG
jgi:hypothetical protein